VPYGRGMDQTWIGSYGWVTLALVNAGLAEQKGRSRWNWFLVSIVLGPIATLFIVTWERVPAVAPGPRPLEAPTRGLLVVGLGLLVLAVVAAVAGALLSDPGLGILAAALAVAGAVALVLHVLAHRRWDGMQRAAKADSER
jgi:DMSO/TMAO reductase YedYZ heme-binding membrane subunit